MPCGPHPLFSLSLGWRIRISHSFRLHLLRLIICLLFIDLFTPLLVLLFFLYF